MVQGLPAVGASKAGKKAAGGGGTAAGLGGSSRDRGSPLPPIKGRQADSSDAEEDMPSLEDTSSDDGGLVVGFSAVGSELCAAATLCGGVALLEDTSSDKVGGWVLVG